MARPYSTAYIFPGQGSQRLGMGERLFDQHPDLEAEADALLGYSIRDLCLRDPERNLNKTQFTQPALFVVNAMTYHTDIASTSEVVDMLAGHSLGEYNALYAAGVFDFATGLRLVRKRGEIMSRTMNGGMAAIIGIMASDVARLLRENDLTSLDVANQNSPIQTVISGCQGDIQRAAGVFSDIPGCTYVPLNVSGAFHSRYMDSAQREFELFMNQFEFHEPGIVVISNVEARPYERRRVRELLAKQITHPVRWMETIQVMLGAGIQRFHEAGPGEVLTRLVTAIREQAPATAIDWP